MEEITVLIVAALPVSELRGAIPLGMAMGLPLIKVITLSIIGNLLPVIPLLCFLEPVSEKLRHFKLWSSFFEWLFKRTQRKAEIVQRYEALGLALFVAIPLPITGAWTGCVAATLFKVKFRYAFLAIVAGVLIASIIVTSLSLAGSELINSNPKILQWLIQK